MDYDNHHLEFSYDKKNLKTKDYLWSSCLQLKKQEEEISKKSQKEKIRFSRKLCFIKILNSATLEKNYKYKSFLVLGYISVKSWFWDYLEFFLVIMKIWLNSNSRLFASKILLFFILGFYTKIGSNNVFSYFRLLNSYFNSFLIFLKKNYVFVSFIFHVN